MMTAPLGGDNPEGVKDWLWGGGRRQVLETWSGSLRVARNSPAGSSKGMVSSQFSRNIALFYGFHAMLHRTDGLVLSPSSSGGCSKSGICSIRAKWQTRQEALLSRRSVQPLISSKSKLNLQKVSALGLSKEDPNSEGTPSTADHVVVRPALACHSSRDPQKSRRGWEGLAASEIQPEHKASNRPRPARER